MLLRADLHTQGSVHTIAPFGGCAAQTRAASWQHYRYTCSGKTALVLHFALVYFNDSVRSWCSYLNSIVTAVNSTAGSRRSSQHRGRQRKQDRLQNDQDDSSGSEERDEHYHSATPLQHRIYGSSPQRVSERNTSQITGGLSALLLPKVRAGLYECTIVQPIQNTVHH
jgi:hypothetical protein